MTLQKIFCGFCFQQKSFLDLVSPRKKNLFWFLGFYLVLIPSKFHHATYGKIFPKPLLPLWYNPNILSKLIKSIFGFYSNYFSSQNDSVYTFEPRWFAKQVLYCFLFLTSSQHLWIVLCTHNPKPS